MTIRRGSMLVTAFLLASPGTAAAWGSDCKFGADRSASTDMRGVERVAIFARAGDLTVKPAAGATLSASGRACASSEKYLEQTQIKLQRDGSVLQVHVQVPEEMQGIGIFYASLDLTVARSGGAAGRDHGLERRHDARGRARDARARQFRGHPCQGTAGDLEIEDSSGDISVLDQAGALRISDSSGDIVVRGAREVLIPRDSSGDIRIEQVSGSVRIEQDSSGQVRVSSVQGTVEHTLTPRS